MKKKILFVINSLGCGGAEKSLVSLLPLFDYDKYDVDLQMLNLGGMFLPLLPEEVCVLSQPAYLRWCATGGTNFRYMLTRLRVSAGIRSNPQCAGKPLHDAQKYWKYAAEAFDILEKPYDAAIAWGQGNPTHFVAEKVRAKRKIAVVNADYEAVGHNREFDRQFYEAYDVIAAVSDPLREIMKKVYPEMRGKIVTLYDVRNQKLIERMAQAENPYEKRAGETILATVGRMVQPKGYDLAVEAARILQQRGLAFRWYLVGDGPERSKVEQLIVQYGLQGKVFCVGAKENPYPYMKNADIYVQTSRFEGFGITLAEAKMFHKPIVTTNFDAVGAQFENEKNGLIVDISAEAIADGIRRMLTDTELRERCIANVRAEKLGNTEEVEKLYRMIEE